MGLCTARYTNALSMSVGCYCPPEDRCQRRRSIRPGTHRGSNPDKCIFVVYVATPFYTVSSSPILGLSLRSDAMNDLFFVCNPEQNGSGRAAVCRNPLDVAGTTVWSHTVTDRDIQQGKLPIMKVCSIAYQALKAGKTPAQASEEAGV